MTLAEFKDIKLQLNDLLDKCYTQPCISPWGAPMLFIKNEYRSLMMVIGYRQLNNATIKKSTHSHGLTTSLINFKGKSTFIKLISGRGIINLA